MRTRTRWTLSLATMVVLAILSGCGGGGTSSSGDVGGVGASSGDGTALPAKTLSWAAPESYTDNTSLNPVTDLEGFEIYVNESGSFADADTPTRSSARWIPRPTRSPPPSILPILLPISPKGSPTGYRCGPSPLRDSSPIFPPPLPSPSDCPFRIPHVEFNGYRWRGCSDEPHRLRRISYAVFCLKK